MFHFLIFYLRPDLELDPLDLELEPKDDLELDPNDDLEELEELDGVLYDLEELDGVLYDLDVVLDDLLPNPVLVLVLFDELPTPNDLCDEVGLEKFDALCVAILELFLAFGELILELTGVLVTL